jgi:methionyl-tRNA synthetase
MVEKYFGGALPSDTECSSPFDAELRSMIASMVFNVENYMDKLMFHDALSEIWAVIRRANKYTDENQPWVAPVMPNTPGIIRAQLNITDTAFAAWNSAKHFGLLPREVRVTKGPAAFPRMEKA